MWRILRDDLATAWRAAKVRLLTELAVLAVTATVASSYGLSAHMPQIYLGQLHGSDHLAQVAAGYARSADGAAGREFFRREAAWYRRQSRDILWHAIRYALCPGYGPGGRDEQSDVELTMRDLATRERLDRHGDGWSQYPWLAEEHAGGLSPWSGSWARSRGGSGPRPTSIRTVGNGIGRGTSGRSGTSSTPRLTPGSRPLLRIPAADPCGESRTETPVARDRHGRAFAPADPCRTAVRPPGRPAAGDRLAW